MALVCHSGSCHCKSITFKVFAPADLVVWDCNCSICAVKRNTHFIVPESQFELLTGADALTSYRFGTGVANHLFCKTCGICTHYRPRSNPDGVAITVFTLAPGTVSSVTTRKYDGIHWEDAYAETQIASQTRVSTSAAT